MGGVARLSKPWHTAALAAVFLTLAGCADVDHLFDDPLIGGGAPTPPANPSPAPETARVTPVPAISAPSSTTSTAALAGGGVNQTLDPNRELRIGSGSALASAGNGPGRGQSGAVLSNPRPATDGGSQTQLASLQAQPSRPAPTTTGYQSASMDALFVMLQARGVTWHRLETWGDNGEWRYSCSVPDPKNPRIRHNFEARGRDSKAALVAVLEQMDKEPR
jgi:hypothetical protein